MLLRVIAVRLHTLELQKLEPREVERSRGREVEREVERSRGREVERERDEHGWKNAQELHQWTNVTCTDWAYLSRALVDENNLAILMHDGNAAHLACKNA